MVNPDTITNFKLNRYQLEELLIFWICVAGKTAKTIAPRLEAFMKETHSKLGYSPRKRRPFGIIQQLPEWFLALKFKEYALSPYNQKARYVKAVANSGLDLKTCTLWDLVALPGIKYKTASCFLMHSRPGLEMAGLDTHVLKFMRALDYDVPKATPTSRKRYEEIERQYLELVKKSGRSAADLDLIIWRVYSSHRHLAPLLIKAFE